MPHRNRQRGNSPQTLSLADRRLAAGWAADCAERVLHLFEAARPDDGRPRAAIARTRSFARGESDTADDIRRRFGGGSVKNAGGDSAASAAARAAGQASAVCHMGAHALGAAAFAAKAAGLAQPQHPNAARDEMAWQFENMSEAVRTALRTLPLIGEDGSGPLGPGLLARGELGSIIRNLQAAIAADDGNGEIL